MTKTFCDLCDREISDVTSSFLLIRERRKHILPEALDICGMCYDKLWNCAAELKTGRVLKQSAIDKTTDHR